MCEPAERKQPKTRKQNKTKPLTSIREVLVILGPNLALLEVLVHDLCELNHCV